MCSKKTILHLRHNLPGERRYVRERLTEIGLGTVTSSTPSSTDDTGSLREDAPILPELLQARNHTRRTLLPPFRLIQGHDIPRREVVWTLNNSGTTRRTSRPCYIWRHQIHRQGQHGGRQVGLGVFLSRKVCEVVFHHRELAVERRRVILPAPAVTLVNVK